MAIEAKKKLNNQTCREAVSQLKNTKSILDQDFYMNLNFYMSWIGPECKFIPMIYCEEKEANFTEEQEMHIIKGKHTCHHANLILNNFF